MSNNLYIVLRLLGFTDSVRVVAIHIYFLRSCSLLNFISVLSPVTVQYVIDVLFIHCAVLCIILYYYSLCIVLFALMNTKLNKVLLLLPTTTTTTTTITMNLSTIYDVLLLIDEVNEISSCSSWQILLSLTAGCCSCHCCCCQVIRDYKLIVIVNLLLVIDLVILSTWQVVDAPFSTVKNILPQVTNLLPFKSQILLRYLVADRSEAGRGPVADLLARANSLLAS